MQTSSPLPPRTTTATLRRRLLEHQACHTQHPLVFTWTPEDSIPSLVTATNALAMLATKHVERRTSTQAWLSSGHIPSPGQPSIGGCMQGSTHLPELV